MTDEDADVVVVGAGPGGSSTALRLARLGHRVTLLDRATFPRDKACSEYTSPETVRHLDALGVLGALDAAGGTPLAGTTVAAPRGSVLTGLFARAGGRPFRATGLALRRSVLDESLIRAAAAAGVRVIEGCTALDIESRGHDGVTVRVRGGAGVETMTGRMVVGADGLRSVVARRAGLHRRGWLRRVAFVAHVEGVERVTDRAELHVGDCGYVGINPLGNGISNVALVVPQDAAAAARGDAASFFFDRIRRFAGVGDRIDPSRIVREVMVTGPFDAMSRRSVSDGILLVGDAADFFDPFTGEGICTALAGGELASRVIDEALAQPGAITARRLAHYRTLRRRAFLGKWVIERMIGYAMLTPALFDRAVSRLERRGLADTLIGVTGNFVSPWRILNPLALAKMIV